MRSIYKTRRSIAVLLVVLAASAGVVFSSDFYEPPASRNQGTEQPTQDTVSAALARLAVKGKAPLTGYAREEFGNGWSKSGICDTRNLILLRDLNDVRSDETECKVQRGILADPYTGNTIEFHRGSSSSGEVQIDHVVALANAWQTGAFGWTDEKRERFANDPLELLAVSAEANQQKSAADAASWLPANKSFRCRYIARQVAVKLNYGLWVAPAEKESMQRVLARCPNEGLPKK